MADRPCQLHLGHVADFDDDLFVATLYQCAQLDRQAVLVTHLFCDAVTVQRESVAYRAAVGVD